MKNLAIGFVLGLIVAGGVVAYKTLTNIATIGEPAKELKNAKTETLTCKPVVVYQDRVKKDLGLPATVTKDPDKKVTASTKVAASDFPNTVTSVYDTGTGATDLYIRRDPLPWLELKSKWRAGVYYGINDVESGVILGQAQYEFLQLKRLKATAIGQVDSSSRWFGGVGVSW